MSAASTAPSPYATEQQLSAWARNPGKLDLHCDVAVVGGGIGGVCAAVAAARRGMKVVLLEPTHMLGGQATSSGVSAMDITFFYEKALMQYGLWGEITSRIQKIYDTELKRPVNVCRYIKRSFGPNAVIVERVLTEMVDEAGIRCIRNIRLKGAVRNKQRTILYTENGPVRATIAIDATENGSLIGKINLDHRIGNSTVINGHAKKDQYHKIRIQDITQVAVIRRLESMDDIPDHLRLTEPPPLYPRYRPEIRRAFPDSPGHKLVHPNAFAGYRAVPDLATDATYDGEQWKDISRTALNFHNDLAVYADYLVSDECQRDYEQYAIYWTLGVLYYLQSELGQPWVVVDDEGFADGPGCNERLPAHPELDPIVRHLPPRPYIRESRRLIGKYTLTGKDIYRLRHRTEARWNVDSIAVGTYPPDLHGGRLEDDLEEDLDETFSDKPRSWREGPFPIPLGTLVPARVDGFIAAEKNISCSRIAAGAIRLHPTVAATGEAAGTLAAVAIHGETTVADTPTLSVQASLAAGGALLAPLTIENCDTEHPEFDAVSLAVTRKLIDYEIVRPPRTRESFIRCDLELAAQRGRLLMQTIPTICAPTK